LLARELETGTQRLAWTQSVTRTRWLATKVAVTSAAAILVTGLYSFAFTWWSQPLDQFDDRIGTANFAQRGFVPIAYALFALALGLLAGAVLRRTLPAMAVTIVGFGVVRFAFQKLIRVHLLATTTAVVRTNTFSPRPGSAIGARDWILSSQTIDRTGRAISGATVDRLVRASCHLVRSMTAKDLTRCVSRLGVRDLVTMHPASQFWPLQAVEAACFLAIAALLGGLCFGWVRRHPS
jgi:ABC-type multidrug transport system fused ATPase/permease subunit